MPQPLLKGPPLRDFRCFFGNGVDRCLLIIPIRIEENLRNVAPVPGFSSIPPLRMGSFCRFVYSAPLLEDLFTLSSVSFSRQQEFDPTVVMLESVPVYECLAPRPRFLQGGEAFRLVVWAIFQRFEDGL